MADQGKFARTVLALSAAVVAVCAVVVTVKVVGTDPGSLGAPRVLDQDSLERQVAAEVLGHRKPTPDAVECPTSVVAEEDAEFTCRVYDGTNSQTVFVKVTDDKGGISASTSP